MTQNIVIVIPGTTGSILQETVGTETTDVWPTQVMANLDNAATLLGNSALTVGCIFPAYVSLLNAIYNASDKNNQIIYATSDFNYDSTSFPNNGNDVVIGWSYDWRVDNATSATALAGLISALYSAYESNNPKLWIVAHSMGGLIARYVWDAGLDKTNNFAPLTPNLITLGTPHQGAPLALAAITGEIPSMTVLFTEIELYENLTQEELATFCAQIEQFSDQNGYPSTYELLPPPTCQFITSLSEKYSAFDSTIEGALENKYDANSQNIAKATQFWSQLESSPSFWQNNLFLVCGNIVGAPTCYSYKYDPTSTGLLPIADFNKGDAVVPTWSASWQSNSINNANIFSVDCNHMIMPKLPTVQAQVIKWIFSN